MLKEYQIVTYHTHLTVEIAWNPSKPPWIWDVTSYNFKIGHILDNHFSTLDLILPKLFTNKSIRLAIRYLPCNFAGVKVATDWRLIWKQASRRNYISRKLSFFVFQLRCRWVHFTGKLVDYMSCKAHRVILLTIKQSQRIIPDINLKLPKHISCQAMNQIVQ